MSPGDDRAPTAANGRGGSGGAGGWTSFILPRGSGWRREVVAWVVPISIGIVVGTCTYLLLGAVAG